MDHTAKWIESSGSASSKREVEPGNWLGIRPQTAALTVLILLGAVIGTSYLTGFPGNLRLGTASAPYPHEIAKVSFAVAGDVIPHEAVRASADAAGGGVQGWSSLLDQVSDVFKAADFGFVNLE